MAAILNVHLVSLFGSYPSTGHAIDDRSEWFNEIIDKIERVRSGSVVNAEGRKQTGCSAGPRKSRADHGVSVVQQAIAPVFVMAPESFKETLPIGAGSLCLQVVRISRANPPGHGGQGGCVITADPAQDSGLVFDFGGNKLLPKPLFERLAHPDLSMGDSSLRMMLVE